MTGPAADSHVATPASGLGETPPTAFASLALPESLHAGLDAVGFRECTPIQAMSLPPALAGRDVAAQAQTGTGKTAAFLLAVMTRLLAEPETASHDGARATASGHVRALIVAPTRELAIQIHRDAESLGAATGLTFGLAYGGAGFEDQRAALDTGVDVIIGTPGRLIDFVKRDALSLRGVQVAVLDEADRMFDLGFIDDIRYLLRRSPKPPARQTLLFSATLSWRVMELAHEHMHQPEQVVAAAETVTATGVSQTLYYPANEEKLPLLVSLLRPAEGARTIVFINTKHVARKVQETLVANGIRARTLSGDVPQARRTELLERFISGDIPVLVATDVAARGLHVPDVALVVNYDLPQSGEDYVHRIGRTARAGACGRAISFACEDYAFNLPDIERYIGQSIPREMLEPDRLPTLQHPPPQARKPPRSRPPRSRPRR